MKDRTFRVRYRSFLAAFSLLIPASAHALTLVNGSIIAEDSIATGNHTFTIVEYSPAGATLQTLPNGTLPANFGTMTGLALIGSHLWSVSTSTASGSIVAEVDLTTGNLINSFTTALSAEGLGNIGGDLLVSQSNGLVRRYTTGGVQVGADINLQGGSLLHVEGLDADASHIYAASSGGNVYTFDLSGNQLSSFSTGDSLSGLGIDPATGNIWVSAGFGSDLIYQYTPAGALVSSFPSNRNFINGLDVVPEPATLLLLTAASLLSLRKRR